MTRHTSRRALAAAVVALVTLPAVAACSATNEVTSMQSYEPGDGVSAHVHDVTVRNMMVISEQRKAPGVLSATAFNQGAQDAQIAIQVGQQKPFTVTVPARGMLVIGGTAAGTTAGSSDTGAAGQLARVDADPGELVQVHVAGPDGGDTVQVPVHAPTGIYSSYTPSETSSSSSTAAASSTSTGSSASATGTATESTSGSTTATGSETASTTSVTATHTVTATQTAVVTTAAR